VRLGALDGFLHGERGQHVSDAVMAVDHCDRARIHDEFRFGHRVHDLIQYAITIPAEAQHAVGLVSPQVRLHQRVGDEPAIGLGHTGASVDGGGEVGQARCIDARGDAHGAVLSKTAGYISRAI
jgi:hypothetical protein